MDAAANGPSVEWPANIPHRIFHASPGQEHGHKHNPPHDTAPSEGDRLATLERLERRRVQLCAELQRKRALAAKLLGEEEAYLFE